MPLVSVLLPVYNAQRYLKAAIDSILNQTFSDFELLIIDDGSTDLSAEIIHSIQDPRIRYLKNATNQKLIRTLNIGLKEAKGAFIARMDSDDISFPQRLERQLQFFKREPATMVNGTYAIRIDERDRHGALLKRPVGEALESSIWFPTPLIHPTVMMRRELIDQGFLYDEDCLHCEDYDFWIRIAKAGHKIENLPGPMIYYRVHSGGVSTQNRELQLANSFRVFRRHYPAVNLTYDEYCGLIGVKNNTMPWGRRRELLQAISSSMPGWVLFHQGLLQLRLRLGWL